MKYKINRTLLICANKRILALEIIFKTQNYNLKMKFKKIIFYKTIQMLYKKQMYNFKINYF